MSRLCLALLTHAVHPCSPVVAKSECGAGQIVALLFLPQIQASSKPETAQLIGFGSFIFEVGDLSQLES